MKQGNRTITCYICGTVFEGSDYESCPHCGWVYTGIEDAYEPDEREDCNLMTINEAKRLVSQGKDVYGDPLPKKND